MRDLSSSIMSCPTLHVLVYTHSYGHIYAHVCMNVKCMSVHMLTRTSIHVPIHLSTHMSIHMSMWHVIHRLHKSVFIEHALVDMTTAVDLDRRAYFCDIKKCDISSHADGEHRRLWMYSAFERACQERACLARSDRETPSACAVGLHRDVRLKKTNARCQARPCCRLSIVLRKRWK